MNASISMDGDPSELHIECLQGNNATYVMHVILLRVLVLEWDNYALLMITFLIHMLMDATAYHPPLVIVPHQHQHQMHRLLRDKVFSYRVLVIPVLRSVFLLSNQNFFDMHHSIRSFFSLAQYHESDQSKEQPC